MRRFWVVILWLSSLTSLFAQSGLDYYLPAGSIYNPAIPTPESVIGFKTGEYHLTYDKLKKTATDNAAAPELRPYGKRTGDLAGQSIPGTIFLANLDTTHPMAYGYHSEKLAIFKEGAIFYKPGQDVYENLAVFSDNPLLSGYVNKTNLALVRSSSAIQRQSLGKGKVILFFDDPLFRGYWSGMHKIFLNAVFWGKM